MPYIGETITGNKNVRKYLNTQKSWVTFTENQIEQAEKFELVHSSFNDPGPDWNSWRLYNSDGQRIAVITLDGY